ncbi:MAG: phage holin family protein [Polyangiaceae bacterium]
MHVVLHLAVLALTILVLSWVLPSVRIRSAGTAVTVAVVFSVLNFFLGWLIWVALFVPALMTLGLLFFFVPFIVNVVMLWLTDKLLANFEIGGTGALLASAVVITLVNGAFNAHLLRAVAAGQPQGSYLQPDWI